MARALRVSGCGVFWNYIVSEYKLEDEQKNVPRSTNFVYLNVYIYIYTTSSVVS